MGATGTGRNAVVKTVFCQAFSRVDFINRSSGKRPGEKQPSKNSRQKKSWAFWGEVSGRNVPVVGFSGRHQTLPQLLDGDKARADLFAPAPHQRAHPKHLAARGEGKTE